MICFRLSCFNLPRIPAYQATASCFHQSKLTVINLNLKSIRFAYFSLWIALLCMYSNDGHADQTPCKSTVVGDLRQHSIESAIFHNTRTIRVLLPAHYDDAANRAKRYPVLIMLDGQNLFDACLSDVSHEEWKIDETVARLIHEKAIPELIVIGIDHAGRRRAQEYLPYKDQIGWPDMQEPAGKEFPNFLADEVIPHLAKSYRLLTGAHNTAVGGASYGGVAALYALLARPDSFGYSLIESPPMWVGMGALVRDTRPITSFPEKVYFGFGGLENNDPAITGKVVELIRIVQQNFSDAGYDDRTFRFTFEDSASHNEIAWAGRFSQALTFLYAGWQPSSARP